MLTETHLADFARDGLLHLHGVVDPADCDAVDEAMATEFGRRGHPDRLLDAWVEHDAIRRLATHPTITSVVAGLLGRDAIPFQTLNFEVGTEQHLHSDLVHFDTIPSGSMVGAWTALEDVDSGAGPLRYVPGSHLDEYVAAPAATADGDPAYARYEQDVAAVIERDDLPVSEVTARRGDVIFWAAGLLHGGAPITTAGSTRRSQVTHYFGEGLTYVTPSRSDRSNDRWFVRDPLIDIRSAAPAPQFIDGAPLRLRRRWNRQDTILDRDAQVDPLSRAWSATLGLIRSQRARRRP